jgi:[protein-PII] uridylyltransferase
MTAATLRALWRKRGRLDASVRRDPVAQRLFLAILQQPRGIVHETRRMNQYDVLGATCPSSAASSARCSTTCSTSTPWTSTS